MTAFTGSTDCSPARLAVTRGELHRVAEHVLATGLYAASGEIGLIPSPGGFRTPRSALFRDARARALTHAGRTP